MGERLRLACGLPVRPIDHHAPLAQGMEECAVPEKYYEPPLINIIKFACNACPEKSYHVTNMCQGCLAHPCVEVCPKKAVSIVDGHSVIDQDKCVKCGQCANACPYGAIVKMERPCAKACGMDAIGSDELGRATIDYDKCVSCGMCLVNCPFGAIADKSQLFQVIQSINRGDRVIAAVAPAFIGQFGPEMTAAKMKPALKLLDLCLVLHADHGGGNNSTFACRVLSSTGTDTYSAIAAAIGSLKGPKHGGANHKVMRQLDEMKRAVRDASDDEEIAAYLRKVLRKEAGDGSGLLYGMGHAVYTKSDPRAVILRSSAAHLAKE